MPCDGIVTVTLSSLLNDYDLHITVNGGNIFSKRPGTLSETITFPLTAGASALAVVRGYGTAYNTFDCYSIGATGPFPCFTGGGGGENMTSSDGSGANTSPIVKDGSLLLPFESAFQNDEQIDVQVFSTDGRLVLSESTQVFGGENQVKLDLPSISDGIYLVNIKGSFGIKSHKVVVAK